VRDPIAPQVGRMVLNANGDPSRFAEFGLPIVADTIEGFFGLLAGILAGLRWSAATAPGARLAASVSTDAPILPLDLVAMLDSSPGSIARARSAGELHPVIGLWPVALADDLETRLKAGMVPCRSGLAARRSTRFSMPTHPKRWPRHAA